MSDSGFSRYSAGHMIALFIIAAFCVISALVFRRLSEKGMRKVSLILGLLITAVDLVHYWVYYRMGILGVESLPVHLCSMAVYVCLIHSIFRPDWAGQLLYSLSLPGVWCALIFPDWTDFPILGYPSLHSFAAHGLIAAYIIMQVAGGRIVPRLSHIWKPVVFLCIAAPVAALINHFLGTNFMFMNDPVPGSPLQFLFELAGGNRILYVLFLSALALLLMLLMYLPFLIKAKIKKHNA